jgi:hypothetical protein
MLLKKRFKDMIIFSLRGEKVKGEREEIIGRGLQPLPIINRTKSGGFKQ